MSIYLSPFFFLCPFYGDTKYLTFHYHRHTYIHTYIHTVLPSSSSSTSNSNIKLIASFWKIKNDVSNRWTTLHKQPPYNVQPTNQPCLPPPIPSHPIVHQIRSPECRVACIVHNTFHSLNYPSSLCLCLCGSVEGENLVLVVQEYITS